MQKREIVEIFGLLSVIGSLIFVGIEISQDRKNQKRKDKSAC